MVNKRGKIMITFNPINSYKNQKATLKSQNVCSFKGKEIDTKDEFICSDEKNSEPKSLVGKLTSKLVSAYANKVVQRQNTNVSQTQVTKETQTVNKTQKVKSIVENEIGVPQEYIDLFENIKDLKGDKFYKAAFYGLREIMGLEDIAELEMWPSDIGHATPELNVTINFLPSLIDVAYEKLSKEAPIKWLIMADMASALKQVQQYCDVLSLGDDAVSRYKEKFVEIYMKQYSAKRKKIEPIVNQLDLSKVENLPSYKKNSPEEKRAIKLLKSMEAIPYIPISIKKEKVKNNMAMEEKHESKIELLNYVKKWEESKPEPSEKLLKTIDRKLKDSEKYYDKYFSVYSSQFDFQGMGGIGY